MPRVDGNERKLLCAVELPIEPFDVTRRDEINNSFHFVRKLCLSQSNLTEEKMKIIARSVSAEFEEPEVAKELGARQPF